MYKQHIAHALITTVSYIICLLDSSRNQLFTERNINHVEGNWRRNVSRKCFWGRDWDAPVSGYIGHFFPCSYIIKVARLDLFFGAGPGDTSQV